MSFKSSPLSISCLIDLFIIYVAKLIDCDSAYAISVGFKALLTIHNPSDVDNRKKTKDSKTT
jgi:hypothetical protein